MPTTDHSDKVLDEFTNADNVAYQRQLIADLEAAYRTTLSKSSTRFEKERANSESAAAETTAVNETPVNDTFVEEKPVENL
ncbi:hypothetical protein N7533_013058 [Penicillium manginii]|uniref:uncharacterized protein n=1 Tax=Penicillium manginii TaxID=203109 RepID=UPI002549B7C7|nr:uncharacterized protein N7533_013058 [Penicillium manginii]KAJ5734655.1 hypothetical protein N7533_013058 [Penicillium manginii]